MEQKNVFDYYKDIITDDRKADAYKKSWKFIEDKNKDRLDSVAISEDDRKLTYAELFDEWKKEAKVLSGYDVTKDNNSRVLVIMPNIVKMNTFDYGSDITGAIASFPDPTSDYSKIKGYIEQEKITDIVSLDLLYAQNVGNKTEELVKEYGIRNIFVVHDKFLTSLLPKKYQYLASVLNVGNKFNKYVTRVEDAERNTRYTNIKYDNTAGKDLASEDAVSLFTHTSGTTSGIGKPIPLTDVNRNSIVNNYEMAKFNYKPGMTMLHFIPYFAGYGAINTVNVGLSEGLELQEIPVFNPNNFGDYVVRYRPNIVLATSACWISMMNDSKFAHVDLSYLVYASTGGSPLSVDEEIKVDRFLMDHGSPVPLTKGYGLSEMGGCAIVTIDGYNRVGSTGVVMPGINAKIKTESGEIKDVGSEELSGELLLNGDTLTCGKIDGKEVVKTIDVDGVRYLSTNDEVHIDSLGYVDYLGRIDGMFQRYDCYNVYPLRIENLFKSYPFVKNVTVVGINLDSKNGVVPKVVIELTEEGKGYSKEDIIKKIVDESFLSNKHVCEYIANYRDLPHVWDFVDVMPTNTMEKNDLHIIKNDDYESERYVLDVNEDNMGVKGYTINKSIKSRAR